MNSVANGKVTRETPFARIFAPPAPGDAGGAIGAALVAWTEASGGARPEPMLHSSYGPGYGRDRLEAALGDARGPLDAAGCRVRETESEEGLCDEVAARIADGEVLGWFQGRMEVGPRALGNRSILCDPRRPDMRDVINAKIKLRESFRPFAPSILREAMGEWFEVDDDVPFMMKVYEIREEKRARIPAVTHVDGTGRPHTVRREANPLYHRLIRAFEQRTGVPMVLNTSFNENEPIVNRPEEALDCFLRTEMDTIVLGPFVVTKPRPA
jgi:carbamoyltransferase